MKNLLVIITIASLLIGCKKEATVEPILDETFTFNQPSHFSQPNYTFTNNPLTKKGFELGRFLFYDPILSSDSSISCSSCHAQAHGFADHNVSLSKGVHNTFGIRNAPSLVNLAWSTSFMWDGGVNHIEVQPLVPLTSEHEMGETMAQIVLKLNRSEFYKQKFKEAFGITKITDQKLLHALAQFTSMLVSSNSKYDQVIAGKVQFTTEEKQGYELFKLNCALCHTEPLFTDYSFRNSGLPIDLNDTGREKVSQDAKDRGKFKVPTLRNIAYTYPYMHDGRFSNLEEVLKFKVQGIQDSPTLDPYLKKGIKLNTQEQKAIISFLNTLTDFNFIGNSLFSEPVR
jgi:cytochrome c peroxidase